MRRSIQFSGRVCGLVLLWLLASTVAPAAQDFRGLIEGKVTDNTGGAVPGATVTIIHGETNVATTAVTNETGSYTAPFLNPGTYAITVELQGFKKTERKGVEVRVGDRLALDFKLEVGGVEETITVASTTPLLETRTASAGQVIDEKRIALMPLSDGNPFVLARLATGIAYTGDLKFSRPFDNGGTSSVTADGAAGGNEFSLDGAPNMANGRRVAFTPPAGAVAEFKVETATFDAQQGHTAGATINVTMKGGTNSLRGDGYYHYRDEKLSSNDFFLERAGRPKDQLDYKRYGFNVGGPVRLGFYNGRDRTFFFSSVEWLYDKFPEPGQFTVPTEAQRNGDFSALLAQGIRIYDPATAVRRADGRVERQPFPNNIIPQTRISPIAREILKYYPLPNQSGDALGLNNYLSTNQRGDDFYSMNFRVDHVINDAQRFFVRYNRNNRVEYRGNWTGEINGVRPTGNFLYRINDAVNLDHVWTISPSTLLNVRGGWSRFQEPSIRQHQGIFDPASLGFPTSTTQYFGDNLYFPRIEMDNDTFADLGDTFAGGTNFSIYSFQPTLTRIMGSHTLRAGYDFRIYKQDATPSVHSAGQYTFARGSVLTRQLDNSSQAVTGQDLAALLLGLPSGGLIDRSPDSFNTLMYQGLFFQDDWKITDKLTLNLGVRYEYEGAPTESEDRNVRGFDATTDLAISAAAEAAYARNPMPLLPASQFNVAGGLRFAGDGGRGFYIADKNNIQPRVGLAYQWNPKTVVRAGWALYTVPQIFDDVIRQSGYAQSTTIVPTLDQGVTIQATLANPFPNGVATPPGNAAGADTFVGRQLDRFTDNIDFKNGQAMRFAVSVQRELPGSWVLEAAYVGNRGFDLTTTTGQQVEQNPVPNQYLSTSPVRDQATIDFLTGTVANPFQGLLPGTNLNGATIARQQLLRPYPQFADIQGRMYDGSSRYDAGQFRLEKRFSKGYTMLATYTISRFKEKNRRLNAGDTVYEERLADTDLPHRIVLNGIYELPFGRNRRWGADSNAIVNGLIGNWSVSAWWNWQSGRANLGDFNGLGNVYYNGDINQLKTDFSRDVSQPMFDTAGFYFSDAAVQTNGVVDPAKQRADTRIQLANNLRTLPTRPENFRGPTYTNVDMSFVKGIDFGRFRAQVHFELYNALNDVFYNNPNLDPRSTEFGRVTSQNNLPRNFQIGMKVLF
jgi:hypothetical protein